jgi:hypothetical protein
MLSDQRFNECVPNIDPLKIQRHPNLAVFAFISIRPKLQIQVFIFRYSLDTNYLIAIYHKDI